MNNQMSRGALIRNAVMVGFFMISGRMLGIFRAFFQLRYLGLTGLSDAFLIAYRLPNAMRKIFGEGALSAAFVPVFVRLIKEDKKKQAESLMSYAFLIFEGLLFAVMLFVWWKPRIIIDAIAPGFAEAQAAYAVPLIRILFPFILCVSSTALLAGALQSAHAFVIPAIGPLLLSLTYIVGIFICMHQGYMPTVLAAFVVVGGVVQLLLNFYGFFRNSFSFGRLTKVGWQLFLKVVRKIGPVFLGMSLLEFSFVLDAMAASYLESGSVTIMHYGGRFMEIPLGVFGVSFATVLLSQASRTMLYARSRAGFYILEGSKMIVWSLLPGMLLLMYLSPHIFTTFLRGSAGSADMTVAAAVLNAYSAGLIFFGMNRILMSISYALHDTTIPTVASAITLALNAVGNMVAVHYQSRPGIALSTVISSGMCATLLMLGMLIYRHNVRIYGDRLVRSVPHILKHIVVVGALFIAAEQSGLVLMKWCGYDWYWPTTLPALCGAIYLFYRLRTRLGVRLYFAP